MKRRSPAVFRLDDERRMLGVRLLRLLSRPEPPAIDALAPAPQVTLTVIHVEAGAHLVIGGAVFSPGIVPAVPQQRAVTATTITEGTGETE